MTNVAAPFTFIISMLLLMAGGLGLFEAQGACTAVCLYGNPALAAMSGVGLVVAGLFYLSMGLNLRTTDDTSFNVTVAKSAEHAPVPAAPSMASKASASVYEKFGELTPVLPHQANTLAWDDKSPSDPRS